MQVISIIIMGLAVSSALLTSNHPYKDYRLDPKPFLEYRASKPAPAVTAPIPVTTVAPPAPPVQPKPAPIIPTVSSNILRLVNQRRAAVGVSGLEERSNLNASASLSVQNMINVGTCCSHGDWPQWFRQAGASYTYSGENIAACQVSDEAVVQVWVNSPTHYQNMVDPDFKFAGVAKATGTFTGAFSNYQPIQCVYYANHFGG